MSFYVYETITYADECAEETIKGDEVMKEVVTVTREQATRIEELMISDIGNFRTTIALQLTKGWATKENLCLNDMDPLEFIGIIAGTLDYEAEAPPWRPEAGEWVARTRSSTGGKVPAGLVFKVHTAGETNAFDSEKQLHRIKNLRPATEEEVMWGELGRQPGEFKEGDKGVTLNGTTWSRLETVKSQYVAGMLKGFYPIESFITFKGE